MNKRQELIDELIKADQDGTYKTYKSTEEIKAMNNEEVQILYSNMKNYLSDKRTHINYQRWKSKIRAENNKRYKDLRNK